MTEAKAWVLVVIAVAITVVLGLLLTFTHTYMMGRAGLCQYPAVGSVSWQWEKCK
jgi:drug/metabolite transporter superfamily protein YnfA